MSVQSRSSGPGEPPMGGQGRVPALFAVLAVVAWAAAVAWQLWGAGLGVTGRWQFWAFAVLGGALAGLMGLALGRAGVALSGGSLFSGRLVGGAAIPLSVVVALGAWALLESAITGDIPARFRQDREAFAVSIQALRASAEVTRPPAGQPAWKPDPAVKEKMLALVEQGVKVSRVVTDEFLDYLHPELRREYREHLIAGTELYHEGVKSPDMDRQARGIALVNRWIRFWEANHRAIVSRAYPLSAR